MVEMEEQATYKKAKMLQVNNNQNTLLMNNNAIVIRLLLVSVP